MENGNIEELVCITVDDFARAAYTEKRLPDLIVRMMRAKSGWPSYVYDADDRKDQEPEVMRVKPSASDIDHYERCLSWLRILGMKKDDRTIKGKKIIWARAYGFSYQRIGEAFAEDKKQVERWYKRDIMIITKKINDL